LLLVGRNVFFGINGIDRALGDAYGAIDALVRVDCKKIRSFAEAINRAYIDAVRVTAADAGFGHYVGHNSPICKYLKQGAWESSISMRAQT
jgi:hypothetical protein